MAIEATLPRSADPAVQPWRAYSMGVIFLLAGFGIGYLLRETQPSADAAAPAAVAQIPRSAQSAPGDSKSSSLGQLVQLADNKAAPLLEKLKNDPNNSALLMQLGSLYHSSHRFTQAAAYYEKAVQADPKNEAARTKLAISLYRTNDVDGALTQLNRVLHDNPGDANALFNLGMIRLQGKQDAPGAIAAWRELLRLNPKLSEDRKAEVRKLMDGLSASLGEQNSNKAGRANGHP
jgi:tetratricopeptide (TPR) repeat protein